MFERFKKGIRKLDSNIGHFLSNYLINDPSTPELVAKTQIPPMLELKYTVRGLSFSPKNIEEKRSLNCYVSMGNCINNIQKHLKNPIRKWSIVSNLQVLPAAGADLNAYYDRNSLKFFYYRYKGKMTYFADSSDIVTHELGHALLDAIRPDFWSVAALEIWSFHEAFSDIVALFNMMSYDFVLLNTLSKTKGNLSVSNNISKLAEEVGILIREITKDSAYLANALRDPAVEKYKYVDPKTLPKETKNNSLAAECHSFGRVFSSAWYEIFLRIYAYNISKKLTPVEAFKISRDFSFSILVQSVPNTARVANFYSAIANTMVTTASIKNEDYSKIMRNVFSEWNILPTQQLKSLSNTSMRSLILSLKKNDQVFKNKKSTIICVNKHKTVKLSDLPMVSSFSVSEDFEIEVPSDEYYEFDVNGNLIYEIKHDEATIEECLMTSLNSIDGQIGKNNMWSIEKGKLVRKFIS